MSQGLYTKKLKAETPPMTVKELREFVDRLPNKKDAEQILDEMKTWYFANLHLITVGEDAAFRRTIGNLNSYVEE